VSALTLTAQTPRTLPLHLPQISLVTPSYNQAPYLRETLGSVANQRYSDLQYIVLDGGSTDGSVDLIREYTQQISHWRSERDGGAAAAIEEGRQLSTGELFNWLNSDDYLFPGTLRALGCIAAKYPDFDIYAFAGMQTTAEGLVYGHFSQWPNMRYYLCAGGMPLAQESTFLRTNFLTKNGIKIRAELSNLFDTVLYEEMFACGARILFIDALGGAIRHHDEAKTTKGVPQSDFEKYWRIQEYTLTRAQRLWRRVCRTRLNRSIRAFTSFSVNRRLVDRLLGQHTVAAKCVFKGGSTTNPDAWRIIPID
jgi:glycosyltransferase involved in cell wall biosynthesis